MATLISALPVIDRIPLEYHQTLVQLLDIDTVLWADAVRFVKSQIFWQRMCQHYYPQAQVFICSSCNCPLCSVLTEVGGDEQVSDHGNCWKRTFCERHLRHMLESYEQPLQPTLPKQLAPVTSFGELQKLVWRHGLLYGVLTT